MLVATKPAGPSDEQTLAPGLNPDQVTPGTVGFLATFFVAVAVFFLIRDMTKRIRRVRYREQLAEEAKLRAAADAGDGGSRDGGHDGFGYVDGSDDGGGARESGGPADPAAAGSGAAAADPARRRAPGGRHGPDARDPNTVDPIAVDPSVTDPTADAHSRRTKRTDPQRPDQDRTGQDRTGQPGPRQHGSGR